MSIKNWTKQRSPSTPQARMFGLALSVALSIISLKSTAAISPSPNIIYAALALFFFSVFIPRLILPVYIVFKTAAGIATGLVVNIALILIFYFVVTPIGLTLKLMRKDLLGLTTAGSDTYWIKNEQAFSKDRYTKQY